jgi:signal peptidase
MKRLLVLLFFIFCFIVGFLSVWGNMPFIPIFGGTMEPELKLGSILIIKPIGAAEIKAGDVIAYKVPQPIREYYNYPPVLAHRIIDIEKDQLGLLIYTKGDNSEEDPFFIRSQNIKGIKYHEIPYLGFPIIYLRSEYETILALIAIVILAVLFYSKELLSMLNVSRLFNTALPPIIKENRRANILLTMRFNRTEKALDNLAAAIQVYAQHLASHTSAVQDLSEASQALKMSSAEQNQIFIRLTEGFKQQKSEKEVEVLEKLVQDFERRTLESLQVRDELRNEGLSLGKTSQEKQHLDAKVQLPPGCRIKPKALLRHLDTE